MKDLLCDLFIDHTLGSRSKHVESHKVSRTFILSHILHILSFKSFIALQNNFEYSDRNLLESQVIAPWPMAVSATKQLNLTIL